LKRSEQQRQKRREGVVALRASFGARPTAHPRAGSCWRCPAASCVRSHTRSPPGRASGRCAMGWAWQPATSPSCSSLLRDKLR